MELTFLGYRSAYACCSGWINIPLGNSIDSEGSFQISNEEKVWNSPNAKLFRESVLDGSFSYCDKIHCPHLSAISGPVTYIDNENSSSSTVSGPITYVSDDEYERYMDFATSDSPKEMLYPKQLNCAYDRSCNIACPSCRKETIGLTKIGREVNSLYIQSALEKYGEHLEEIFITGSGDAFGSPHFWDLLRGDFLLKYPNLKIRLHTNALLLTKRRWEQISHLHDKILSIEISIDAATKSTYEVNRFPGKWNVLTENMSFIGTLKEKGNFPEIKLDYVVQENNWKEMSDFVVLANSWNADIINFTPLNNWGTFTQNEYLQRAIHLSTNNEHLEFLQFMSNSCFKQNNIEMGFLFPKESSPLEVDQRNKLNIPCVEISI